MLFFLSEIFNPDYFLPSVAIFVVQVQSKNPDCLKWMFFSISFLSPARCPYPKVYVDLWISLIDTSTLS
jgi:hypothetical protein